MTIKHQTTASIQELPTTSGQRLDFFVIRFVVLTLAMLFVISFFNINIGAVGQGMAFALVGVSTYITFRILSFPDLTVDGAFPLGGAVCAAIIVAGGNPELSLMAAFLAGAVAGFVTALITILLKIEGLLSSIIVVTGIYTVTLRVLNARSNVPLIGEETVLSRFVQPMRTWLVGLFGDETRRHANNIVEIVTFGVIITLTLLILNWFMHTELGLTIRATGKNSQMVRAIGINHNIMLVLALMIANGLAGLAGALVVQQLGFADVSLGFGVIIRGLAAVMIGEVLLAPRSVGQHFIAAVFGMVIFEVSRAWVFSALELPTSDIRMVSALVVLSALAAPNIAKRWRAWRQKNNKERGRA